MSSRCDKLRADALLKGLSSDAGRKWRDHAESCDACRSELHIVSDLEGPEQHNLHLKRSSVQQLLQEVDRQGRHYRRLTPVRIAFQTACLLALGLCAAVLYNTGAAIGSATQTSQSVTVRGTLDRVAADMLGEANQGFGIMEFTAAFADDATATHTPVAPTADDIDARLNRLRGAIDHEREQLLDVCDSDVDASYWTHFRVRTEDLTME